MKPGCTVLTPTIVGREELLAEAIDSVLAQTEQAANHVVMLDADHAGPAVMRNVMLGVAKTEWVAFLDDDDLLDKDHLEALSDALSESTADLAFSWHRTFGAVPLVPRFDAWGAEPEAYMAAGVNVVPVTVIARKQAILDAGGFNPADRFEDYSLWMRMLARDARFVIVPRETWTYRMIGENRTWA